MKRPVSIVKGTAVLTAAGFIAKVFGAVYRMYLSRMIGAEGIGLYQMAYPIYLIFLSLSTAGIPIAVSKIVAEKLAYGDHAGTKIVFKASLLLMFLLGTLSSLIMAISARWVAVNIVFDPRAIFSIWALSPAIFLMSIMAVFRGYFQGGLNMEPSAYSQIFEQIVRVAVSLILAFYLLKLGIEHAAAGAAFGATAGGAAGLAYLLVIFFRQKDHGKSGSVQKRRSQVNIRSEMAKLVRFALPISITVILMPLLQSLDTILVPNMLQKIGYTIKQSTAMLGILGNSWAVVYLPLIVTGAIAANMVPIVAGLKRAGSYMALGNKLSEGTRLALIYLIPAVVGLNIFGGTIYRIIYGETGIYLLSWFAPAVFFLGLEQVSAGILQGLGRPKWPLFSFLLGAIVKVIVTLITTGWPGLNLAGAALGTVCGSMTTALLNFLKIRQVIPFRILRGWAPPVAGIWMFWVCRYLGRVFQFGFLNEFLIIGALGVTLYLIALWSLGGINRNDLEVFKGVLRKKGAS